MSCHQVYVIPYGHLAQRLTVDVIPLVLSVPLLELGSNSFSIR